MDPDQTAQMHRLVWIHAGRKPIMLVLSWGDSNAVYHYRRWNIMPKTALYTTWLPVEMSKAPATWHPAELQRVAFHWLKHWYLLLFLLLVTVLVYHVCSQRQSKLALQQHWRTGSFLVIFLREVFLLKVKFMFKTFQKTHNSSQCFFFTKIFGEIWPHSPLKIVCFFHHQSWNFPLNGNPNLPAMNIISFCN
jgi:hypothetical protein